jgi:hypothetical protein
VPPRLTTVDMQGFARYERRVLEVEDPVDGPVSATSERGASTRCLPGRSSGRQSSREELGREPWAVLVGPAKRTSTSGGC